DSAGIVGDQNAAGDGAGSSGLDERSRAERADRFIAADAELSGATERVDAEACGLAADDQASAARAVRAGGLGEGCVAAVADEFRADIQDTTAEVEATAGARVGAKSEHVGDVDASTDLVDD